MAQEKDVARLVLELSADVAKLDRGMRQGQRIAERRTAAIEKSFEQMNKRTTGSVNAMSSNIRNAIGGLALAAAAREVQQYADAWTRMGNPLRAAGKDQATVNAELENLVQISLRSRSSLEGTVTLYNRLIAASGELGVSQQQVARVVETVNKALATSNLTAGERASAVTQLAQGLGSGNLAGDELKAIRENSQVLAQAIADEFDTTIGKLKELGAEGKLTSAGVFRAIENATVGIDAGFAKTNATISDAFTNLQTKATQFVGQLDASTGASEKLGTVIGFVADHLDDISNAAGLVAVTVGGGYVAAMTAAAVRTGLATVSTIAYQVALIRLQARQTGATAAQIALNAAMTANPVGLLIVGVAALAAVIFTLQRNTITAAEAQAEMGGRIAANDEILGRYEQAQIDAKNATAEHAKAARDNAAALREEAAAALTAARALATERVAAAGAKAARATEAATTAAERTAAFGQGPFSNSSAVAMQSAQRMASTAMQQQTDAQAAAAAAVREQIRLDQEIQRIAAGVNLGGGGGGSVTPTPTTSGGGGTNGGRQAAAEVDRLRDDLEAIQNDLLTDVERAAKELAERTATIREAVRREYITPTEGAILEGGAAAQDLQLPEAIELIPWEDYGREISEGLAAGLAAQQQIFQDQGNALAYGFLNIVTAENPGEAIGMAMRNALLENLQDRLASIFSTLLQAGQKGGGIGGSIAGFLGSAFGGNRALGGPVKAGMTYRVNENTPRSEFFTPSQNGYVGNLKPPSPSAGRGQAFTYAPVIDARGADQAAVIRLQQAMAEDRRTFERRTKAVVNRGLANDTVGPPAWK